jgi:hypothetical protein
MTKDDLRLKRRTNPPKPIRYVHNRSSDLPPQPTRVPAPKKVKTTAVIFLAGTLPTLLALFVLLRFFLNR